LISRAVKHTADSVESDIETRRRGRGGPDAHRAETWVSHVVAANRRAECAALVANASYCLSSAVATFREHYAAVALLLSRQILSASRFLCRMRIAASSARRFNSASPGVVNRKNSKSRFLISFSPVLFVPSFLNQRGPCPLFLSLRAGTTPAGGLCRSRSHDAVIRVYDDAGNKLGKCSPFFIRVRDETLSVVAVCVSNPDRSPYGIHG